MIKVQIVLIYLCFTYKQMDIWIQEVRWRPLQEETIKKRFDGRLSSLTFDEDINIEEVRRRIWKDKLLWIKQRQEYGSQEREGQDQEAFWGWRPIVHINPLPFEISSCWFSSCWSGWQDRRGGRWRQRRCSWESKLQGLSALLSPMVWWRGLSWTCSPKPWTAELEMI